MTCSFVILRHISCPLRTKKMTSKMKFTACQLSPAPPSKHPPSRILSSVVSYFFHLNKILNIYYFIMILTPIYSIQNMNFPRSIMCKLITEQCMNDRAWHTKCGSTAHCPSIDQSSWKCFCFILFLWSFVKESKTTLTRKEKKGQTTELPLRA